MIEIIPSLLDFSAQQFLTHIRGLKNSVSMIQIDIADGVFVPNTTWADPKVIQKELRIDCELHLMVANPLKELARWQKVERVKRILVHIEAMKNPADVLPTLHAYGWEIGFVLNPQTPLAAVVPYLSEIKEVMFMGVVPGKQGQPFVPDTYERIRTFKAMGTPHLVAVDGAVNSQTLPGLIAAGADIVCPGSAIFGNERTPAENVQRLRELIQRLTS